MAPLREVPKSAGSSSKVHLWLIHVSDSEETRIPIVELRFERAVENAASGLQHQVRAGFRPTHLLAFREALSDHRVDGGLDEGGRDPLPVSMPLGIIRNGVCIVGDVGVELIDTFAERLDTRVCGVEALQVDRKTGNAGQSRAMIAVP